MNQVHLFQSSADQRQISDIPESVERLEKLERERLARETRRMPIPTGEAALAMIRPVVHDADDDLTEPRAALWFAARDHAPGHLVLSNIGIFKTTTDAKALAFLERNWQKIPYSEVQLNQRFEIRRENSFEHVLKAVSLTHQEIKSLRGLERVSADNRLRCDVMNYYFHLVAHTVGISALASHVARELHADKEYKTGRNLVDHAIIPICQYESHWIACIVHVEQKELTIIDSLGPRDNCNMLEAGDRYKDATAFLRRYLSFKTPIKDVNQWTHKYMWLQRQPDVINCGLFACLFVRCLYLKIPWREVTDFVAIRQKMLWEVVNGRLLPY